MLNILQPFIDTPQRLLAIRFRWHLDVRFLDRLAEEIRNGLAAK
jgi:hypothetical protein